MKRPLFVGFLAYLILSSLTPTGYAQSKTGPVMFTPGGKESVDVTVGDKLTLTATYKQISVGKQSAVSVSGDITNNTAVKMSYSYHVAFLDKDKNLIGCHNFNLFVNGGEKGRAGTFVVLPPDQIARIAFYSVALHESE
jgi:hypothetical protein